MTADAVTRLPFGPITSMTLGNGLVITNEFDQFYRLTNSSGGTLYNRTYGYYGTVNIESITDGIDPLASQNFTYDNLGRLTHASGKYGELSYLYDPVGNRISSIAGEQATSYGYDSVGNLLAKNEQAFSWSMDNPLLRVEQDNKIVGKYGYDARGLRTMRTVNDQTIMTLYDQSGSMLVETDGEGNVLRGNNRGTMGDRPQLIRGGGDINQRWGRQSHPWIYGGG